MWKTLTRFPHTHRDDDGYDTEQLWLEPRRWGAWMNVRKIIDTTIFRRLMIDDFAVRSASTATLPVEYGWITLNLSFSLSMWL
jgi:hypothetical protein